MSGLADSSGLATLLVGLCLVTLPLATAPNEIATGLALAAALASRNRVAGVTHALAAPTLALALVWLAMVPATGNLREGLGHAWPLAPLLAIPVLRADARIVEVGLGAAAVAGAWAVLQALDGAHGHAGFSHHLTLAYALLPPLGVAIARRRWVWAAPMVAGILATSSEGAAPALVVTILIAQSGRRWLGLGAGVVATLALLPLADPGEIGERAILWTGGLELLAAPVGPDGYRAASALVYDRLQPGFWFPNHAHDTVIQHLAVLGPAGLAALAWLAARAIHKGERGAAAGLAGVLVGGLTQDVLGDLEVARATWTWLAVGIWGAVTPPEAGEVPAPASPTPAEAP